MNDHEPEPEALVVPDSSDTEATGLPDDVVAAGQTSAQQPVRIGPYELGARIGSGGLGTVYSADGPGGPVAIKVLHADVHGSALDDVSWLRRQRSMEAEVVTARRAAGPGVVRIVDADLEHDPPYLVMEMVDAPNLYDLRRVDGPLVGERLERFANSLLTAMAHIHLVGIVHGDLKPTNVLVAQDGTAHVVDFGLASLAGGDVRAAGLGRGTPGWRAPEVEMGEAPTVASDVYGWGRVVDYASGSVMPAALRSKVDAALSPDLARRRAVYVPPSFPIPDSERSIPDTVPPLAVTGADSTGATTARSGRFARGAERRPVASAKRRRASFNLRIAAIALMIVAILGSLIQQRRSDRSNTSAIPAGGIVVFDEGFKNGFSLNEFNGVNDPSSTNESHSGEMSLATTPTRFDGFLLWVPDGEVMNAPRELRMWVLVAEGDDGAMTVTATRDIDQIAGPPITLTGIVPGEWSEVVISLDELIVDRKAFATDIERMLWFNSTSPTARPTIYVDDISLA